MLDIKIPGGEEFRLEYLVMDFNGTMAVDGNLIPGVKRRLEKLAKDLKIFVITADTFGKVKAALRETPCEVTILPEGNQDTAKLEFVKSLGSDRVVAFGNGRNDALMLEASALGIAVLLNEGVARETLFAANILVPNIVDALDLLLNPLRLKATLRR